MFFSNKSIHGRLIQIQPISQRNAGFWHYTLTISQLCRLYNDTISDCVLSKKFVAWSKSWITPNHNGKIQCIAYETINSSNGSHINWKNWTSKNVRVSSIQLKNIKNIWFVCHFRAKKCCDVGLLDPIIIESCLTFYSTVCEFILYQMEGREVNGLLLTTIPPQQLKPTAVLSALPEWYVEDIADFILFNMQWVSLAIFQKHNESRLHT